MCNFRITRSSDTYNTIDMIQFIAKLSCAPLRALRTRHTARLPYEAKLLRRIRTEAQAKAFAPWGMQPNTSPAPYLPFSLSSRLCVLYHFSCHRSRTNAHIFTAPLPRDEQEEVLRLAPSAKKPISCEHRDEKSRKR